MFKFIFSVIALTCASLLVTVVLAEWFVGCGEPIYHADGTYITGECVFLPHTPTKGSWR